MILFPRTAPAHVQIRIVIFQMKQTTAIHASPVHSPYSPSDYGQQWLGSPRSSRKNSQNGRMEQSDSRERVSTMGEVRDKLLRGALLLREGRVKQGGMVLKECEKVLQEAGDRGEDVEEGLILTLLHNLAFFHQLEWDLRSCSTYLQALTYNLNRRVSRQKEESAAIKHRLSQYWLVSCGVSSQLSQHEAALMAARKVNDLVREALLEDRTADSRCQQIRDFASLPGMVERRQAEQLRETAMCLLSVWVNKCSFPNRHIASVIDRFKQHTIANAMHLEPLEKIVDGLPESQMTQQTVIERAVLLSMSYFTIATELRLIYKQKENSFYQEQENSQWLESECYHLLSIIVVAHFVPFDLMYLQNILTSYQTHYKQQLSRQHYSSLTPSQMIQALSPVAPEQPNEDLELQTYVRESLHVQSQASKEYARLNQYYYNAKNNPKDQVKNAKSKQGKSKQKSIAKKASATSHHSTQKTPIVRSPRNLSPNRQRPQGQRSQKTMSQRHSCLKPPKVTKKEVKLNGDYQLPTHTKHRTQHLGSKENQAGVKARVGSPGLKTTRNPSQSVTRTLKSASSAGQLGKAFGSKALMRR